MKFQVIFGRTQTAHTAHFMWSEQSTGRGVEWINSYLDQEHVRRLARARACASTLTTCCTSFAGGPAFIAPVR